MPTLKKYREEMDVYEMSFASRLSDDWLLSAEVTVSHMVSNAWQDVTSDVLVATTVVGPSIQFQLKPAADSAQPAGLYQIVAKVNTSSGRILVGKTDLTIR